MRIVLGANQKESAEPVIRLIARLGFPNVEVHTLGVIEPFYPYTPPVAPGLGMTVGVDFGRIEEAVRQHCETLGEEIVQEFHEKRIRCTAHVANGRASDEIQQLAHQVNADLIAVGGGNKGAVAAMFFGSVTRELSVHSDLSVLIGRGEPKTHGPIKAVFATDHSAYARKGADELLRFGPLGFSKLTILSCYDLEMRLPLGTVLAAPETFALEKEKLERAIHHENKQLCEKLAPLQCEFSTMEVQGSPIEQIAKVMEATESELLIIAAQGHGARDRLVLGSTAHHQVANERYSVLVLRPK